MSTVTDASESDGDGDSQYQVVNAIGVAHLATRVEYGVHGGEGGCGEDPKHQQRQYHCSVFEGIEVS